MIPKELRKKLVDKLDDMIKLKGVGEMMDGPALNLAIKTLDKYYISKKSLDFQENVVEAIKEFVEED